MSAKVKKESGYRNDDDDGGGLAVGRIIGLPRTTPWGRLALLTPGVTIPDVFLVCRHAVPFARYHKPVGSDMENYLFISDSFRKNLNTLRFHSENKKKKFL